MNLEIGHQYEIFDKVYVAEAYQEPVYLLRDIADGSVRKIKQITVDYLYLHNKLIQ